MGSYCARTHPRRSAEISEKIDYFTIFKFPEKIFNILEILRIFPRILNSANFLCFQNNSNILDFSSLFFLLALVDVPSTCVPFRDSMRLVRSSLSLS
jgi:hypothetical protein